MARARVATTATERRPRQRARSVVKSARTAFVCGQSPCAGASPHVLASCPRLLHAMSQARGRIAVQQGLVNSLRSARAVTSTSKRSETSSEMPRFHCPDLFASSELLKLAPDIGGDDGLISRPSLDAPKTSKFYKIFHHIKFYSIYKKH